MFPIFKNRFGLVVVIVGVIVCSTVLQSVHARAGMFDSNEDEESGWDDWGLDSGEESDPVQPARTRTNDEPGGGVDHSHHHSHQEPPLLAAGPLGSQGGQASSWDPAKQGGGMQSGSYAAHNESCSPKQSGKQCAPDQNLECSATDGTGRCECVSGYVYVRQTETCWYIPKSDQDSCAHDIQCHSGQWGHHSRCSKATAKCECFDYARRETVLIEGTCYIKKSVGDLCRTHEECDKTIRGDAYCKLGDHQSGGGQNYTGSCQCRDTHMYWSPFPACLPMSTKLGDKCYITEQCQQGSLGPRSKCMPGTVEGDGTCECFSPHNGTEVVYYEKLAKCFKRKEYNDTCTNVDECRASLGPDVECGPLSEETPDENVCHCPTGKVCRSSAFSILFAKSSFTLSIACTAAVVGVASMINGMGNFGVC